MGRGVGKNRKISCERVRKLREPKKKILIAVEGKNKTEKNYFNNFENGNRSYNITYARGNNTDPLNLVKMLIKEMKLMQLNDNDLAYCVFDIDMDLNRNKLILEAISLAKKNNINVITSTPCIELWFLLHYAYTTANIDNDSAIKRLKCYFPKYEKNFNIFPHIIEYLPLALDRAKKLEKYQLSNKRKIGTVEANPCTEIYKLVEVLLEN